jgi:hypothetical protein
MKLTRRALLLGGLGVTQATLISRFGSKLAYAAKGPLPTKFLSIYVPGGWMPSMLFPPFSASVIDKHLKTLTGRGVPFEGVLFGSPSGAPNFFASGAVMIAATGAMGGDPGPNAEKQPVRVPRLWNPSAPTVGTPGFNENGYSWVGQRLHNKTCVIHGVDQGTAAHESGVISSVCGAAGSQFRAPAAGAVIANALWAKYKDARPLPSVTLSTEYFTPNSLDLPGISSPIVLGSAESLGLFVSDRNDAAWKNFRERSKKAIPAYDPAKGATTDVTATAIDEYLLAQTRTQRGLSSAGTDAFYSGIYEGLKATSNLLAQDVVGKLQALPATKSNYDVSIGGGGYAEGGSAQWRGAFDMALRLIRSDLVTSVSLDVKGNANFYFDTHAEPFEKHLYKLRQTQEVVARFLGEMDAIPNSSGTGSLLDETLVFIHSEFSRTYTGNGHWPTTSVVLVGGGINGNQMIGNYDLENKPAPFDPIGIPVPIIDDQGNPTKSIPKSSDVCATIYAAFGINEFFIPGGYGEIVGVKAS